MSSGRCRSDRMWNPIDKVHEESAPTAPYQRPVRSLITGATCNCCNNSYGGGTAGGGKNAMACFVPGKIMRERCPGWVA